MWRREQLYRIYCNSKVALFMTEAFLWQHAAIDGSKQCPHPFLESWAGMVLCSFE